MLVFPEKKYKCVLIDPPWPQKTVGVFKRRPHTKTEMPYRTMSLDEIKSLPIRNIIDDDSHIWLWTTNRHVHDAFHVLDVWGLKYLNMVTWVKPSGVGAWFVNTTQHLLFAYPKRCIFKQRYMPTHLVSSVPKRHSEKPVESYLLIEKISYSPMIELFARSKRCGWDIWGDEAPP